MKVGQLLTRFAIALATVSAARGQGTFQNLNFEAANLSNPSGQFNQVPIGSALPDWSGSIGGVPVTLIWANGDSTGTATIDVFGPGWTSTEPGIIDGNYTVFLQAGAGPMNGAPASTSLSQNGTVPTDAESLEFDAVNFTLPSHGPGFLVSFDGNSLSPVVLSAGQSPSGQPFVVYGADISAFAGQTGELEFTSTLTPGIELDDITFSAVAVTPEPSTLALMLTSGAMFGLRCWRGKRP